MPEDMSDARPWLTYHNDARLACVSLLNFVLLMLILYISCFLTGLATFIEVHLGSNGGRRSVALVFSSFI